MSTVLELASRPGKRPTTRPRIPHQQLNQLAPVALQEQLWERMIGLAHVQSGASGISLPDTRALHLDPAYANGPKEAYLPGAARTEFAHLHGPRDGSLHVTLPRPLAADAIDKGRAELHPIARDGIAPPTLVMVYGPRDDSDLEVVWQLVQASHGFAFGTADSARSTTAL